MKAIVRSVYGSPDVLELADVDMPAVGDDGVLVRVRAASLNAADLDYLYGKPFLTRMGTGLRRPRNHGLGLDVAGQVEAVGRDVTTAKPGDDVFGDLTEHGYGAFAEYACAPERAWAPKPVGMTFEEAATVPQAAILALQGLRGRGRRVRAGQRVLVNGASGNVGPFAVQIAKAFGAEVTGVCSTGKMDLVRELGADHVIDYTREDVQPGRPALRLDRGHRGQLPDPRLAACADARRHLRHGRGSHEPYPRGARLGPVISLAGSRQMGLMLWWKPFKEEDVAVLVELIEAGAVAPVIDRRYPLAEVADALRYLKEGRARGKIVITM